MKTQDMVIVDPSRFSDDLIIITNTETGEQVYLTAEHLLQLAVDLVIDSAMVLDKTIYVECEYRAMMYANYIKRWMFCHIVTLARAGYDNPAAKVTFLLHYDLHTSLYVEKIGHALIQIVAIDDPATEYKIIGKMTQQEYVEGTQRIYHELDQSPFGDWPAPRYTCNG